MSSANEQSITQSINTESSSNSNYQVRKPPRNRSEVWKDFVKFDEDVKEMVDGKEIVVKREKAECIHCHFKTSAESRLGTTHLKNHITTCSKKPRADICQMLIRASSKKVDGTCSLENFQFDNEKSRYKLAQAIIAHEYPFNLVTHRRFLDYLHSLRPEHIVPSRNTITELCMNVYVDYKKKLFDTFSSHKSRISFTMDKWTASSQQKSYLCVTSHFIDDAWNLQRRVVGFIKVRGGTGIIICDVFMSCMLQWNIDSKIFTVTVDNDTANDVAISLAKDRILDTLPCKGSFFHVRCAAHIINLVVQDGLKQISEAIHNVRKSIKYVTMSPQVQESFYDIAKQLGVNGRHVFLDVCTRWNSTYDMLSVALEYKQVFSKFRLKDNKYNSWPSEDEWNHIDTLSNCLKRFSDLTKLIYGSDYCTANLLFEEFCEVLLLLNEWERSSDTVIVRMATAMKKKFMKYWFKANKLFTVATFLDPRYKLVAIKFYYEEIYGFDSARRLGNIVNLIKELHDEYSQNSHKKSQCIPQGVGSRNSLQRVKSVGKKRKSRFDQYIESCQSMPTKTDLDIYMDEGVLRWNDSTMEKFDILAWWRGNIGKYPILARIAQDVFAVPVSTIASESTFSTSGRVIRCHRSRMKKETIEALILTQDWLRAEDGASKVELFSNDLVNKDARTEDEYVTLIPTTLGDDEVDEYILEQLDDDY